MSRLAPDGSVYITPAGAGTGLLAADGSLRVTSSGFVPLVLAQSAVKVDSPANTDENILASVVLPGGLMGLNGLVRVRSLWTWTSSGNIKTIRVRVGGISGQAIRQANFTNTVAFRDICEIQNRNSLSSQVYLPAGSTTGGWGSATSTNPGTATLDTSGNLSIVLTAQKATGSESMALESYQVEVIAG